MISFQKAAFQWSFVWLMYVYSYINISIFESAFLRASYLNDNCYSLRAERKTEERLELFMEYFYNTTWR